MSKSEQWSALEMKDAQTAKSNAAMAGNLKAVMAAEEWITHLRAATEEQIILAADKCLSIAPEQRKYTYECMGYGGNKTGGSVSCLRREVA